MLKRSWTVVGFRSFTHSSWDSNEVVPPPLEGSWVVLRRVVRTVGGLGFRV